MATEKRLIDANALIAKFPVIGQFEKDLWHSATIRAAIDNAPTVDAVEVVHGRWEPTGDPVLDNIYGVAMCSICGYEYAGNNTNYCPNCGADMRGKTE